MTDQTFEERVLDVVRPELAAMEKRLGKFTRSLARRAAMRRIDATKLDQHVERILAEKGSSTHGD